MTEEIATDRAEDPPALAISSFWLKRFWLPLLVPSLVAVIGFGWNQITAVSTLKEGLKLSREAFEEQKKQSDSDRLLIQQIQLEAARSSEQNSALAKQVERISEILREIDRDVAGVKAVQEANGG